MSYLPPPRPEDEPNDGTQSNGGQPPYGGQPQFGAQQPFGTPDPYGTPADQFGTPPPAPPAAPFGAYGAPASPYASGPVGSPPPNNLVWAILTTVLCCLPAGVVSIVFASQVNSKWATGDVAGAQKASANARTWAIVSAAVGVVALIIGFASGVFEASSNTY